MVVNTEKLGHILKKTEILVIISHTDKPENVGGGRGWKKWKCGGKILDRNNFSGYNKEGIIKKLHKHVEARINKLVRMCYIIKNAMCVRIKACIMSFFNTE